MVVVQRQKNRSKKYTHVYYIQLVLNKIRSYFSGGGELVSTNVTGKTEYPFAKEKDDEL